jgi:hypothetical protein
VSRDLDDELWLIEQSRMQRRYEGGVLLAPPVQRRRPPRAPRVDWDEAVALALAIATLGPYLVYLVITSA